MKTKKILSLVLAVLMIASVIPMTFVSATAATASSVLAGGYTTLSLFSDPNKTIAMNDTSSTAGKWLGTTSAADLYTGFNSGDGIMFKVDASNVPAGDDYLELMIMMSITAADGKNSYVMLHSGGVNGYYSDAQKPVTPSTWYVSADGVNWSAQKDSSDAFRKPVTNYRGVTYIYIPFSEMYMRHSLEYFATGTNDSSKPGASFLEVKELCGGWANAQNMIQFFQDKTNPMSAATISEVSFVFEKEVTGLVTPEKLPNGSAYNGYNFFAPDVTLTYGNAADFPNAGGAYTGYPYMNTAKTTNALNGNGGIMFKVDASEATSGTINFAFRFTVFGNNGVTTQIFSHGDALGMYGAGVGQRPTTPSTWYVTKDGKNWTSLQTPTNGVVVAPLAVAGDAMYVYIPYSSLYLAHGETHLKGGTANSAETIVPFLEGREMMGGIKAGDTSLQLCVTGGANGTVFSEFQFATEPTTVAAPTTLPDGKTFVTESLFSNPNQQIALNGDKVNGWIGTTSAEVIGRGFNNAAGIMFKIDASKVAEGTDALGLMMMMSGSTADGKSSEVMLHSGGVSGYYADSQKPTPASTWYISVDGGAWTAIKDDGNAFCKPVSSMRGEIYVYVPVSEMYTRYNLGYFTGSGKDSTQPGANFLDAGAACGGWKAAANMIQIRPNGEAMKAAILSELAFVYETPDVLDSASISLKESLTYNVYANPSALVSDLQISVTVNGETVVLDGAAQTDGRVKYSFANVLPQQITDEITVTATYKLLGEQKTVSITDSIFGYLKNMLADSTYAEWHNLAQAIVNYAAAAQDYKGDRFDGTKIDAADVKELANAVTDYAALEGADALSVALGADSAFKRAALNLEGVIELKVAVANNVTAVNYTINGRTGTATVENGAVYIPVYANEMGKTITVTDANNAEDVLSISVNWYVATLSTENAKLIALIDAIANYGAAAAAMQ